MKCWECKYWSCTIESEDGRLHYRGGKLDKGNQVVRIGLCKVRQEPRYWAEDHECDIPRQVQGT